MVENYSNPVFTKRYAFILKQVSDYAKGKSVNILDLGCGVGNLTFPLAKLGHNVLGIDMDAGLIKQCIENNKYPNARFLAVDAHLLKNVGEFDICVCCEVLEHTKSPGIIAENIKSLLKPNGILILTIPNGYCALEIVMNRILDRKGKSTLALKVIRQAYGVVTGTKVSRIHPFYIDSPHLQFFTLKAIRKMFGNFKLEVIEHADLGVFIPGAGRMAGLKRVECRVAEHMPHSLVGGWMLVLRK